MSHGPLMPCPAMVSRTLPWLSRTSRQPAFAVAAVPLADGRLRTRPQPCTTASAVVSPMPPGQAPGSPDLEMPAKRVTWPAGEISTIVLPVPCRLALSLKLLTSTSPRCSLPWLLPTTATPYGLTSPLDGTVDARVVRWRKRPRNEECAFESASAEGAAESPAVTTAAPATASTAARGTRMRVLLPLSAAVWAARHAGVSRRPARRCLARRAAQAAPPSTDVRQRRFTRRARIHLEVVPSPSGVTHHLFW